MEQIHETVFYVSPEGDNNNSGLSFDKPVKTITEARDRIRKLTEKGMSADITVYLLEGEYYLNESLVFSEKDGGKDGYKVIYKGFTGKMPVINGGQLIKGWEHYKDGIYMAQVENGCSFHTLYENDACCIKARYPKKEYNRVAVTDDLNPKESFYFSDGDIPFMEDKKDLQIFVWPGGPEGEWNWFSNIIDLHAIDYSNRKVTLTTATPYEMGAGSRYYIQGALELLTAPGEFYLDSENGLLYYHPISGCIEDTNIVAPKMNQIVVFTGSSPENMVSNIVFEGITIRNSDAEGELTIVTSEEGAVQNGAVYLENASGVEIRNCKIHNTGMHGIIMNGAASDNTVTGNEIFDIGNTGVHIQGYCFSSKNVSGRNKIRNNHIHHCGRLVGHGAGIQLVQSGNNNISHNRIHHTPRYSISMKLWPAGFLAGRNIDGTEVTKDNAYCFSYTRSNVIEFNDVSHANTDSQDTGLIESWGAGHGNIIRNNRLHDSEINFSFGVGLYLDDASNFFTVYNNIIHGLQKSGKGKLRNVIYAKGIGNHFFNNIIADNNNIGPALTSYEMFGEPNRDLKIEGNIFYNSGDLYNFDNWSDDRIRTSDRNLLYNKGNDIKICIKQEENGREDWLNLEQWGNLMGKGYDRNSIVDDPRFMNPKKSDYRLTVDSPVYKLGFKDFDLQDIGLEQDFLFTEPMDKLAYLFVRKRNETANPGAICMMEGELVELEVLIRTEAGFIADRKTIETSFTSSDTSVAAVDEQGWIKALKKGICRIEVTASRNGEAVSTDIYIVVSL